MQSQWVSGCFIGVSPQGSAQRRKLRSIRQQANGQPADLKSYRRGGEAQSVRPRYGFSVPFKRRPRSA
jgi:hypothetical protein